MHRIGVVQMRLDSNIQTNTQNILNYIQRARTRKIDILCFPECALTGYIRNHQDVKPNNLYKSISILQQASNLSNISLVVGSSFPWRGGLYNSALIIRPHLRIKKYYKLNLTEYDKKYFLRGKTLQSFKIDNMHFGVLICRDQNDPFLPKRFNEPKLIFYLSSHYYQPNEIKVKERKNKAFPIVRAIENKTFVAKSDSVGIQHGLVSVGTSMIVDPHGVVIAEAPRKKEALLELNL